MAFKKEFGFWQGLSLAGILALIAFIFLYGFQTRSLEDQLKKAEKRWAQKKYQEAITLYLKIVEQDPKNSKNAEFLLKVGDIYNLSLNQVTKALQTYDLVTVRYPSTPAAFQAFVKKGEIYFSSGQYQEALKEYQNILENFPNLQETDFYRLRLGVCHLKLKQFESARREFKIILDRNIKTPLADQVLFHTANSYFLEENPQQAIPIYQSLIAHYPQSTFMDEAKFNLADCYEDLGQFDQALLIYKQIQATYPNPKVIELQIQKNQQRKVEAEKHLKKHENYH